jgi:hypothetical protein
MTTLPDVPTALTAVSPWLFNITTALALELNASSFCTMFEAVIAVVGFEVLLPPLPLLPPPTVACELAAGTVTV